MSFAIIETGGKQYKVSASKILEIEKLNVKVGETIVGEKKLSLVFDLDQKLDTWVLEETTLTDND